MMSSHKLLIIDDDARNIFALSTILKVTHHTAVAASGADQGIDILKNDKGISLVLMDMMMPDKDGYEAIAEIKSDPSLQHIKIIAVTAQAMLGDKEKCLEAGADGYISKPIDFDALQMLLDKYLK